MFLYRYHQGKDQSGLTLVELLGVAVILIVLSLIALPVYAGVENKARHTKSCEDLRTISDALERYYLVRGSYPVSLESLVASGDIRQQIVSTSGTVQNASYWYAVNNQHKPTAYVLGDITWQGSCTGGVTTQSCLDISTMAWANGQLPENKSLGGVRCSE